MSTKKFIAASFILAAGLLLAVAPAYATPVPVAFVGVGGENQNGYYTYPYYLTLNHGPSSAMICDDFYDHVSVGETWMANVTQLTSGDLSHTLFGNLHEYEEAAYLLFQTKYVDSSHWGDINWAIWKIFDPNIDPGSGHEADVNYWLNKAETADLSKINFSGVEIVTPTTPGPQEFLYATPEPGTLMLVGGGLLGMWARRRRKA